MISFKTKQWEDMYSFRSRLVKDVPLESNHATVRQCLHVGHFPNNWPVFLKNIQAMRVTERLRSSSGLQEMQGVILIWALLLKRY